jgi:hypothetical protein
VFVMLVVLAACDGVGIGGGDDDDVQESCPNNQPGCEAGDVCRTVDERCECSFGFWKCEPEACPEGPEVEGAACEMVGLMCAGPYPESPGNKCVGPELVWAVCSYYHQGGPEMRNGCPPTPPAIGLPCCQGYGFGGAPLGCRYDQDVIDCVNDHWVQTE